MVTSYLNELKRSFFFRNAPVLRGILLETTFIYSFWNPCLHFSTLTKIICPKSVFVYAISWSQHINWKIFLTLGDSYNVL